MDELEAMRTFRADLAAHEPQKMGAAWTALRSGIASNSSTSSKPPWRMPRVAPRWAFAGAAACAATAAAVAIGLTVGSTGHGPAAPKILRAEAQEKFPSETLSDVVSWSDQVSIVTAIGASEVPDSSPQSPGDDVRLIGRDITYHIDQTIWHRAGAPELTGTFTAGGGGGWETSSDHPKVRIALEGAPWVEVGEQYVMPLALDQGKWGPYSSSAVVPYVNGKVVPDPTQHTQLAEALKTLPATELSPLFATAIPDPDAARHFDLRPTDRLCAVMADRGNLEPEDRVALGCS